METEAWRRDGGDHYLSSRFSGDAALIRRPLCSPDGMERCVLFQLDGMTNGLLVAQSVVEPVERYLATPSAVCDPVHLLSVVTNGEVRAAETVDELPEALMNGDCVLTAPGGAILIGAKGWMKRATQEPDSEKVIRGPRESFIESSLSNLAMLRRKLQTTDLRVEQMSFGELTHTRTYLCYLDSRVNPSILRTVRSRLKTVHMEGVLDSNYLLEQIRDCPRSPFKTVGVTERPDIAAAKLLEGRVAILVDGSPCALTAPCLFIESFQANDDYYTNYLYATVSRWLRMAGFFLTVSVPAIYVALVTHHPEVLPRQLLLSISASRQGVPFPSVVETVILLLAFEILREASVRMPSSVGQALSIVGALVLGQAAVEARLVSAPLVIVIALAGTTSLLIPSQLGATILVRSLLLTLCAAFGMVGLALGYAMLFFHLASLTTVGVPYLSLGCGPAGRTCNDAFHRARWGTLRYRRLFGRTVKDVGTGNGDAE